MKIRIWVSVLMAAFLLLEGCVTENTGTPPEVRPVQSVHSKLRHCSTATNHAARSSGDVGQCSTLRRTAGFLTNLARAVETRSFIVSAVREDPAVFGYSANENLVGRTHWLRCWRRTHCDYGRECMRIITVDEVCAAAEQKMPKRDAPLPLETTEI